MGCSRPYRHRQREHLALLPIQVPAAIEQESSQGSQGITGGFAPMHPLMLLAASHNEIIRLFGRAERAYQRAVEALAAFDKKHPGPLSEADQPHRRDLVAARDLAQRQWLGAQRFQRLLSRLLWSPTLAMATARLDQLIRVAAQMNSPYLQKMGMCLTEHRAGLLVFFTCLESGQHQLRRLSRSRQRWVALTTRWALPITSNAAEHVFRCLRRYTNNMDHFVTSEATQRFFDLFVFFHNVHVLRAGKHAGHSLLTTAQVDVLALFGTDDPYTMLGFPPASQTFKPIKSVQSIAGQSSC